MRLRLAKTLTPIGTKLPEWASAIERDLHVAKEMLCDQRILLAISNPSKYRKRVQNCVKESQRGLFMNINEPGSSMYGIKSFYRIIQSTTMGSVDLTGLFLGDLLLLDDFLGLYPFGVSGSAALSLYMSAISWTLKASDPKA